MVFETVIIYFAAMLIWKINDSSKKYLAQNKDKFIDAQIEAELRRESDYLFTLQVRDYLVKKADLKMPAAFLKRWLYTINEGMRRKRYR